MRWRLRTGCSLLVLLPALLESGLGAIPGSSQDRQAGDDRRESTLQLVFADSFRRDTRSNYQIEGGCTWAAGELTLDSDASVVRTFNGAPWVRCDLSARPKADAPSGFQFGLSFRHGKKVRCVVRLVRSQGHGQTGTTVELLGERDSDGLADTREARRADIPSVASDSWAVEYQRGVVTVFQNAEVVLAGYLATDDPIVSELRLEAGAPTGLSKFAVSSCEESKRVQTVAEMLRLVEADAANAALVRFYQAGRYAEAARAGERSLRIRRSILGVRDPGLAVSLANLAGAYSRMGDATRAEPLFREAIEIEKRVLGEWHPEYAVSLNNLAGLYLRQGEYARAEPLYRRTIEIEKRVLGERHPDYAISLDNLAGLYVRMGDFALAEPLYRQTIEIGKQVLGERHPDYAISLNNLAGLYNNMGQPARAEPLYKQALQIKATTVGEQHPSWATTVNDLASLYESTGDLVTAEPLYEQAAAVWRESLGERHPNYAIGLNNLAGLAVRRGDFERAERLFQEALEIRRSVLPEQHPSCANSLHNLASVYESEGALGRANGLAAQAVQIIRRNLDTNALVQSERQQKRSQSRQRFYLDSRVGIGLHAGATPQELLETMWQWKGAVTFRQRAYRQVASNPELASMFEELRSTSRELSALTGRTPVPPADSASGSDTWAQKRAQWESQFATVSRRREELEQQIAGRSREFREIREALSVVDVQSHLAADVAFIDFLDYRHSKLSSSSEERRYVAFVVRSDGDPAVVDLGAVDPLNQGIETFRRSLVDVGADRAIGRAPGQMLREKLWLPIARHLEGVKTVIVSPDTLLGTLPFAALPGGEPDSYLIEEYRFATVPLAAMLPSLLDENRQRPQAEKGLLIVGDVDYGQPRSRDPNGADAGGPAWLRKRAAGGSQWDRLAAAAVELADVERLFRKKFGASSVTTLDGTAATETTFMKLAPRHYNLHLVTHAFFAKPEFEAIGASLSGGFDARHRTRLGQDPTISQYLPGLLSGIVLAGANVPPEEDDPTADGILTAAEIETLDLNAVDLVVLSACDTGLGKTAGGEGLTGLQRAFHVAGARSCVATLWEVPDKATQQLMSRFYRYYWEDGQSKIDALHNAQLDVLRNRELTRGEPRDRKQAAQSIPSSDIGDRTHPWYWGAFILSGDWR